jgi:uncharacterized membrane protein YeaQ/YmgE (transglycosylase-associated protein family)
MECVYLILLFVALAFVGWIIDFVIPGRMPYGIIGGIVAAIIGGLIGGWLFGNFGPTITWNQWSFSIIPAILGGLILAVIVRLVMGMTNRNRAS